MHLILITNSLKSLLMSPDPETQYPHKAKGFAYAMAAFGWWAFFLPSYFKLLTHYGTPPFEAFAERILFGFPVLLLILAFTKQLGEFRKALTTWHTLKFLIPSTCLIFFNWFFFIYSVATDRMSHAAMGYYINPLFSIALGFFFLGERMSRVQWVAVALAGVAVIVMGYAELTAANSHGLPWIALILPTSFGFYGLLRKNVKVSATVGLTFEMMFLAPIGIGLMIWLSKSNTAIIFADSTPLWLTGVMLLGGIVTIIPMVCFTNGVRLLPLSTVGLLQYSAPTGQLLLSFIAFGETFTPMKFFSFAIIWAAIIIYTWDMLRGHREMKSAAIEMLE